MVIAVIGADPWLDNFNIEGNGFKSKSERALWVFLVGLGCWRMVISRVITLARTGVVLGLLFAAAGVAHRVLNNPQVVLLTSARGAEWIRADQAFNLTFGEATTASTFRTDFMILGAQPPAILHVAALGKVVVLVDEKTVFDSRVKSNDWRHEYSIRLPIEDLTAGIHHLVLAVSNRYGPSLVRADCAELGIKTDAQWKASASGRPMVQAVLATDAWEPQLARHFPTAARSVRQLWPWLLALFVVGAGAYWSLAQRLGDCAVDIARWMKWTVVILWLILAGNNLFKVPRWVGYDLGPHLQYIQYVAAHWRAPLPDTGWQYFQSPLYYFLSAILLKLIIGWGQSIDQAIFLLRVIPLSCGILMCEVCYRAARLVYPGRAALQGVVVAVGGLLPVNIYMSQVLSNEPLAALLGAVVAMLCIGLLCADVSDESIGRWFLRTGKIGVVLGLAIMTKISGLVWLVPVMITVAISAWKRNHGRWSAISIGYAGIVGPVAVICGGYFLKNYLGVGAIFLSHSQNADGQPWWQYPGYRTPAQFFRFGRSLAVPAFGDLTSIWDQLYDTMWSDGMLNGTVGGGPPWNYVAMACGLWLSVALMIALVVGVIRGSIGRWGKLSLIEQHALRFSIVSLACFLIVVLYVCLTLPIFSCVKSSYLLGATPCLALLVAAGFDWLTPNRTCRAMGTGVLFCWAAISYATYFVL